MIQALRFYHKFNDGEQKLTPTDGMYHKDIGLAVLCNSFQDGTTTRNPHEFGIEIRSPGTYRLSADCRIIGPKSAMFVIGLDERRLQNIQIRGHATVIDKPPMAMDITLNEIFAIGRPCFVWMAFFADWYEMSLCNEQLYAYRGINGWLERIGDYTPQLDIALIDKDARAQGDQTTTKG